MSDATFRAHVRAYLAAVAQDNQDATPAELLELIAAGVEDPPMKPHRVKVPASAFREETVTTEGGEGDPRPKGTKVTGSIYSGPVNCPDCGLGLSSRGEDMMCARLDRELEIAGQGGIVACGVKSDG